MRQIRFAWKAIRLGQRFVRDGTNYFGVVLEEQRFGVKPERSWQEASVWWIKKTRHMRSHDKDVAKLRWLDRYLGLLMLHQVTRDLIDHIGVLPR